jgi:hypothetical protein
VRMVMLFSYAEGIAKWQVKRWLAGGNSPQRWRKSCGGGKLLPADRFYSWRRETCEQRARTSAIGRCRQASLAAPSACTGARDVPYSVSLLGGPRSEFKPVQVGIFPLATLFTGLAQ